MEKGFEEQVHDAACAAIGEAVWQLIAIGEPVNETAISSMILLLSKRRPDLADSIALSVLDRYKKARRPGNDSAVPV